MVKTRVNKICAELKENEAALVSSESGRLYLTGFHSSAGVVLLTHEKAYFLIDFRYIEKATECVNSCEVILMKKQIPQLKELLFTNNIKTLYLETERLDVATAKKYRTEFAPVDVSEDNFLDKLMTDMRAVKSREELELIKCAQAMTDETFDYILEFIEPGRTEMEIALEMEFFSRKLGSEGVAFDFIVVSGSKSSMPHGVPDEKVVEVGDFITMDFGAVVSGYRSDMTRTVAVGGVTKEQREVYDTVLRSQLAALDFIKAGKMGKEVDAVARNIITDAGYGEHFGHGLGHSVGIEIHESPCCNTIDETPLKAGTVMTIEPGIYLPGKFGVRIEDMVYVTETGSENLTHSPKELIIL